MDELIHKIISNQLRDFAGTRVEGKIVLSDELINEVLTLGRQSLVTKPEATAEQSAAPSEAVPQLDLPQILGFLKIEKLQYRTEKGKTIIEVKGGIPKE